MPSQFSLFEFVALAGLAAAAETAQLRLSRGETDEGITLIEGAVAASILLLPTVLVGPVVLAGVSIAQLLLRRRPLQIAFNTGQLAAATVLATATHRLLTTGNVDPLSVESLLALVAAMVVFATVNFLAVSVLLSAVTGRPLKALLVEEVGLTALTTVGSTALGAIAAVLWQRDPAAVLLLTIPAAVVRLAYRGVVEREELLEAARVERDQLEHVVADASDGIVLLDADGTVKLWSPAMTVLTGVDTDDAAGRPLGEILPELASPLQTILAESTPDAAHARDEVNLTVGDGATRTVAVSHAVRFDDDHRVVGDVVLFRDITREREADQLKDDFLARVTHELRTPITPILGFAQTLQVRPGAPEPMVRQALDRITSNAHRLRRLVDDLLLVNQMRPGGDDHVELEPDLFDLVDLVARIVADTTERTGRPIDVQADDDLPPVFADEARVTQVLDHLVTNACKYSPEDTPVTLNVRREGRRVAVDVTDRGRGIPPEHVERIFDRFHRVEDPLTMETSGAGIGLFIARRLVEHMGGELNVDSTPEHGSTFTATFHATPFQAPESAAQQPQAEDRRSSH